MESKLAEILRMKLNPVAIIWSDDKPEGAAQFKEDKWGCVMMLFAQAAKGRTAVFDRETFGCFGGGTGLGFENQYENFTGGEECFYYFLSTGLEHDKEKKKLIDAEKDTIRRESYENFMYGERYVKSPELVKKYVKRLPLISLPTKYVIFKPLKDVDEEKDQPMIIIFSANPDQLAALTVMANYERNSPETVYAPFVAGCQSIGIMSYQEIEKENPRAVIGMIDISARIYSGRQLGKDIMTFSVPLKMFHEMEDNIPGSFLERHSWQTLVKMNMEE